MFDSTLHLAADSFWALARKWCIVLCCTGFFSSSRFLFRCIWAVLLELAIDFWLETEAVRDLPLIEPSTDRFRFPDIVWVNWFTLLIGTAEKCMVYVSGALKSLNVRRKTNCQGSGYIWKLFQPWTDVKQRWLAWYLAVCFFAVFWARWTGNDGMFLNVSILDIDACMKK